MRAAVRGWCPDLFTPMQSGDGWLLRIKPRLARLTAAEASAIAQRAAVDGNGVIELTGRGNLQIRGLTPQSAARFARFAVEAGLADPDPAVERRRNILLSPLAGAPACALATALEQALAADTALAALPGRFGFAVDAGTPFGLPARAADIVLRAASGVWPVDAVAGALAAAHRWLAAAGEGRGAPPGSTDAPRAIGALPSLRAFGVGMEFGQADARIMLRLCDLSQRYGDGVLHLTPWRAVILSGVAPEDCAEVAARTGDLVIDPDDPRRLVSACIGRAGCASGSVDARADARALLAAGVRAPSLHGSGLPGSESPASGLHLSGLHVSGCAKGCAHPGAAAITLVGADGRYGLVRAGRAGDTAQTDGLTISQLARRLGGDASGS